MRKLRCDGGLQENLRAGVEAVERRQSGLRHEFVQARQLAAGFQIEVLKRVESGALVRCRAGQAQRAQGSNEISAMH